MNTSAAEAPTKVDNNARLTERTESLVRRVASDLLTIEVNTIIKPCMTARKMPPPPVALFDIVANYSDYLVRSAQLLPDKSTVASLDLSPPATNGRDSFSRVLENAEFLEKQFSQEEFVDSDENDKRMARVVILRRISHYCHLMGNIIKDLQTQSTAQSDFDFWNAGHAELYDHYNKAMDISIDPHYVALIRKSWDMGVEQVVMQTVIQLDGDMISRIQKGYEREEFHGLQQLHLATCRMGVETWQTMTQLVIHFIEEAGKAFINLVTPRGI